MEEPSQPPCSNFYLDHKLPGEWQILATRCVTSSNFNSPRLQKRKRPDLALGPGFQYPIRRDFIPLSILFICDTKLSYTPIFLMIKLIQVAVCKCIINWSKPEFSGRNENMRQQESWEVEDKRKPETERPQLILDSCQTKYISLSMLVETIIIAHLLYLPWFVTNFCGDFGLRISLD